MTKRRVFQERKRSYSERIVGKRVPAERFLIVCEGEKTEPNYFRSFRVPREVAEIKGLGDNTLRIVEAAVALKQEGEFEHVWCVFDRDSFKKSYFNAAFFLAQKNQIKIAYSNESFELWYLLHFNFYNTGISRKQYGTLLDKLLGHKYEKNSREIYSEILHLQHTAIKNADRLLNSYTPIDPESNNPSTTVHLLVMELNRFLV